MTAILHDEKLAYADEQTFARRAWWLELHTGADLRTGTTIQQLEQTVERVTTPAPDLALPDGFEEDEKAVSRG